LVYPNIALLEQLSNSSATVPFVEFLKGEIIFLFFLPARKTIIQRLGKNAVGFSPMVKLRFARTSSSQLVLLSWSFEITQK
jgi:hypothetical protein